MRIGVPTCFSDKLFPRSGSVCIILDYTDTLLMISQNRHYSGRDDDLVNC